MESLNFLGLAEGLEGPGEAEIVRGSGTDPVRGDRKGTRGPVEDEVENQVQCRRRECYRDLET